jgi:hypothetical protein
LTIDGGTPDLLNGTDIDLKKTIPTVNTAIDELSRDYQTRSNISKAK